MNDAPEPYMLVPRVNTDPVLLTLHVASATLRSFIIITATTRIATSMGTFIITI
jgi:hypothetical protein